MRNGGEKSKKKHSHIAMRKSDACSKISIT